ncbi:MAG: hypothetical protein HY543_04060 [Deltaproteobacteria bacterium]|nr:hypothetical protein [Deltaproteobacteria bacterium]
MVSASVLANMLADQLADPDSHWGLGSFGAIAEFTRDRDEPVELSALSAVTDRGGISIHACDGVRATAFETVAGSGWNQNVVLCLPVVAAAMNGRAVLSELGPDRDALRDEDKKAVLFDLGLAIPHVDAFIRLRDPAVIARLRGYAGQNVFAPGNDAMSLILAAQPHRVFVSRCARVEVYQPIPPHDGRSPQGPHTHVLPKLLAQGRTHAATEPIPEGLVPCLSFYPAHPLKDALGHVSPFEAGRHDAFQALLRRYGDPEMIALTHRVAAAVASGEMPSRADRGSRYERACIRIALRQLRAAGVATPSLALWLEKYERPGSQGHYDISGCH